jgi:flagellar basal-body rod modification protein FlgD
MSLLIQEITMDFQPVMSSQERAALTQRVDAENKKLAQGLNQRNAAPSQNLGKDDFLKILLTQLAHQDPTAPMQDKEFIAQMAQFSSLEQMTNMAADFAKMARMLRSTEAAGALGRAVEVNTGNEFVQGVVQAVTRDETPQIMVNGRYYAWDNVTTVFEEF